MQKKVKIFSCEYKNIGTAGALLIVALAVPIVPLTAIRQMLGHKDLETTMIYLRSLEVNRQVGTQVLSDAYRRLLDNKKTSADTTSE